MSVEILSRPSTPPVKLSQQIGRVLRQHQMLIIVLVLTGLTIFYVNPFHETSILDDWAYILTSRHLYDTGVYHLHEWSSANLMFQAYWGALFGLIGGFSIGMLHVSTLVLFLIGLLSFYLLAQDHGLTRMQAALLTLCLVANPVSLYLAFSFMTDVPSLSLLITSLMFYTRGLKRSNRAYMLGAGLVTVAAMFTRPTSLALLAGLAVIFWLDKTRKERWRLYLAGAIAPVISGAILLLGGTAAKFSGGSFNGSGEIKYILNFGPFLGNILLWRPGMFLIYIGVFTMPLVLVALAGLTTGGQNRLKLRLPIVLGFTVLIIGSLLYSVVVVGTEWTVPYMEFNLIALHQVPLLGWLVTIIALPGGVLFGTVIWQRVANLKRWQVLPLEQRFVDVVTLFMLLYQLLFFNLGDRYLFMLLPFSLLVMGRYLQPRLDGLQRLLITAAILVIIPTAIITRFYQAEQAAEWKASDYALSLGTDPARIYAPWGWFCSYNYPDYLVENLNYADIYYMFDVWRPQAARAAIYSITDEEVWQVQPGWQLVKTISYTDGLFQQRAVYVVKQIR